MLRVGKPTFALLGAIALSACSSAKPAAHTGTTSTSAAPSTTFVHSSTSTTIASAFPSVVTAAMKSIGSTKAPLVAPRDIPLPPSVIALSATTTSNSTSWSIDLYATPIPLAVNDPSLSKPPYGPSGPSHVGTFGASQSSSAASATAALDAQAANLDHDCRSQLSPVSLGVGISAQRCANGTGTTFLWTEGDWHIGVDTSNSAGPADTQLANQIASYLHTAYLPAPSSVGVIAATATGGPQATSPSSTIPGTATTTVTIDWAVGATTLHFSDDLDALGGLRMAVSEAPY